jgi:hypothetical protein
MAFWMSLLVSHGNQKFLQMKYFPRQAGRLAAWGCGRKDDQKTYEVQGENFVQLSILNPRQMQERPTGGLDTSQVSTKGKISFGSISRPEKVADATYNRFVLDLLDKYSPTAYLYAGREEQLAHIPVEVRRHPQARALGWVDPAAAIREYHIYLESFPWGGGDMCLLALENQVPYLILDTPQNRVVGIYSFLDVIAQSNSSELQFSFCDSMQTLADRFGALVADGDLRASLGKRWAQAIDQYHPSDIAAWLSFLRN